ncbi:MAG TPA: cytochrome c3 family protein [Polyangiaceae bacterium]|nr:cytochrome c3 family protein [Polyangiaceae bacterium]
MRPLFPPWSDTVFRLCLVIAVAAIVVIPTMTILWVRTPYVTKEESPVEQPVQFDHRHHVRDDGIDCLYCHYEATRSKFAGVPPTSVCMNCHSQVWQESGRLAPIRDSWFGGGPLRWRRVHQLPQFVYFDHSAHVSHGVGCAECHGRVDLMPAVYPVAPLTMEWCLDCHRDPEPHLRPLDQITNMEWTPAGSRRAIGAGVRQSLHVDPPVQCSGCHR